jgi:hypothetical protein
MNFRFIGAAALSLVLATPAMAMHHRYHHDHAQDALQNRYGSTYGARNFYLQDQLSRNYDGSFEDPFGYDPVPPSANGG